jgi:alpha-beta hydrolase superfamily lysophospholipase
VRLPKPRSFIVGSLLFTVAAAIALWVMGSLLSASVNHTVGKLPADLNGRDVQFLSDSGATIHGWLIPGLKGSGAIVLMHGVRASRLDLVERARFLSRAGFTILLFDFQAHGESPGQHITFGYLESRDARAAVGFLRTSAPGEKIGVLGISLGGAAALLAVPPLNADAIVLEMVYPTFDQAIGDRLAMRLGNWSRTLTPLLTWQLKLRSGFSSSDLRPIDHMSGMRMPKLLIAGAEDRHKTLAESRELFAAASEPKELWVVDGARHQDLHAFAKTEYEQRVLAFFAKNLNVVAGAGAK